MVCVWLCLRVSLTINCRLITQMKMNTNVYLRMKEKWMFGDITIKDFVYLVSVIKHFHPTFQSTKVIESLCAQTPHNWVKLDESFVQLASEMGDEITIPNRLENIKKQLHKLFYELLHTITDEEISYISNMDYGEDTEQHADALKTLVFKNNGIFSEGETGYPHEVVLLSRHYVSVGHEREFIFANMIMVHNLLWGRYTYDILEDYYSEEQKAHELSKVNPELLGIYMTYIYILRTDF